MKKISAIIILLYGTLIMSCLRGEKCDPVKEFFRITALTAEPAAFSDSTRRTTIALSQGQEVSWNDFLIEIGLVPEFIAEGRSSFFKGNLLYAREDCPRPGERGTRVGLERIDIVTLNDYNDAYRANDTITEIVNAVIFSASGSRLIAIDDLVARNDTRIERSFFSFNPIQEPSATSSPARFRIIFELKNGEIFEQETVAVVLRK